MARKGRRVRPDHPRAPSSASRRSVIRIGSALIGLSATGIPLFWRAGTAAQEGSPPPERSEGGPPSGSPPGGDEALAEPFVGITTDGTVIPGLFPIQATGVSTAPVVEAAQAFLAALAEEQRMATLFAVDDDEWRTWTNVHSGARQGTSLREMDDAQRAAAMGLLEAALSVKGLQTADGIMKLNHTEGELMNNFEEFDEDLYWFVVLGEPSETEPWGWQLDGHHLVINYFVLGDQVVMTPAFWGSEPTIAPEGTTYAGLSVLIPEQDQGLAMVNALTAEQLAKAIISTEKSGADMQAGANSDNAVIPYAGINAGELTTEQQEQLLDLIALWVGNLDDGHAAVQMDEVRSHLDETHFAWIGETGPEAVFYYRIQSPVILIEFDHQSPGPLGQQSDFYGGASGPQRLHVHAIVRTPNGNDYGKDLLAEHYATSPHHAGTPTAQVMGVMLAGLRPLAGRE